jgi:hypothetical protein
VLSDGPGQKRAWPNTQHFSRREPLGRCWSTDTDIDAIANHVQLVERRGEFFDDLLFEVIRHTHHRVAQTHQQALLDDMPLRNVTSPAVQRYDNVWPLSQEA